MSKNTDLGAKVKALREKCGMSRQEFSDYLGIPKGTIRNWEQGARRPMSYTVSLIERVLKCEHKI